MCELCLQDDEKNILIEIRDVHIRSGAKFEAGIGVLEKALGYDSERQQKEISPFKSVRDLEALCKDTVERGLLDLYEQIGKAWLGVQKAVPQGTYVLNNRILLNPATGKPLTKAQWAVIKKDVLKAFDYIYAGEEERIALHALALGKVLKGMPLASSIAFGYQRLKAKVDDTMAKLNGPQWQNAVDFATQHAGEMIVELKQSQFKKIHDTIQTSIKNRHSTYELQEQLFDKFGEMNRDWRRIAETEIGSAQNNGQLLTELENVPEGQVIFMRGVSASEACPWCRGKVDGTIVVLLEQAPSSGGDQVQVNNQTYTAIWPGKDNYGRNRRNWWIAAGTQHPHCRCTWVRYIPGFEKWDKLIHDAMDAAMRKGEAMQKPIEQEKLHKPVPWKP